MKNAMVYGIIFILAFVGTTIGIFTLNNKYENIFEFDLRDASEVARLDSLALMTPDSLSQVDSVVVVNNFEEIAKEYEQNYAQTKLELEKTTSELNQKDKELEQLKNQLKSKADTKREEWLSSTIKLYEAMESSKAGQLIRSLPEKEGRELIYRMKKKKAAEILSSLDTETIKRLTRVK